jgi:hypothetical protein
MRRRFQIWVITYLAACGVAAAAEDAKSVLAKVQEKQLERWEGVDRYAVDQSVLGNRAALLYERYDVKTPGGRTVPAFRAAPVNMATADANAGVDSGALATGMSQGLGMTGSAISSETEKGLQQAGLPPGLLKNMGGGDPWLSPDPGAMMTGLGQVTGDMAGAEDRLRADASSAAAREAAGMSVFADKARLVGTETVDGRNALHLRAENMDHRQAVDGQTILLDSASIWIDAGEHVPLRSKIEGTASSPGESRPILIETSMSDYRKVAGSRMYEPYRRVVRIAGVMTPEQQAELRDSQAQLADLDRKLAEMPEDQRQMVMRQMGPQLEAVRKMSSGEGFQMESVVHQIVVNPDATALNALLNQSTSVAGQHLIPAGAAGMAGGAITGAPPSAASAVAGPAGTVGAAPVPDTDAEKKAAQQACLARKVKEAEEANKKKQGLGRLMSAVSRVAGRYGGADVSETVTEVYSAKATAADVAAAARDLGLTESDIEECRDGQ